eukprot:GHVU01045171.1.p1 GENE.GHVU01045171.1~~GHVU01045171.1.p1  ORF type:complete len:225 (+),score=35.86 GHVU01045171.1:261-935(+)
MSTALLNCFVLCYCVRISYHQPAGLRGTHKLSGVRKDELCEDDCEESVQKDGTFRLGGEATYYYKYFAKVFPGWETPNLKIPDKFKANWEFQRSFFVEYQKRLAKYWKKKVCTRLPQVTSIDDLKPALEMIAGERAPKRQDMEGRREVPQVDELRQRWNKMNKNNRLSQEQREPIEELLKLTGLCAVKEIALRVYEDVIADRDHGESAALSKSFNFAFIGNPGV